MARKPGSMYRRLKGQAFTRRQFTGGVPNNRIMKFHLGNRKAGEAKDFEIELTLSADESCQIRHTALEAARVISNSTCSSWSRASVTKAISRAACTWKARS